jgi:hypothetical protein
MWHVTKNKITKDVFRWYLEGAGAMANDFYIAYYPPMSKAERRISFRRRPGSGPACRIGRVMVLLSKTL